jgi:hypothetical protein
MDQKWKSPEIVVLTLTPGHGHDISGRRVLHVGRLLLHHPGVYFMQLDFGRKIFWQILILKFCTISILIY